ncbi:uncharacterized protein [Littorina saxatilis]
MADERGVPSQEQKMEEEKQDSEQDEESEEEESDEEDYFEVEKIMARRKRNNIFVYRVRWKGYPPSNDTWEPVENLEVVQDMVEDYDRSEEDKAKARQEERRMRKLRMEGKRLPGEESSGSSSDSSDDERLLNEDTKFFKMLEKNKDIVFGQPDLYSKVKSRTAALANKKKNAENQGQAALTKRSCQPEKKDSSHGRGRPRGSAVRGKGSSRGRGRPRQKFVSEDESSDNNVSHKKSSGKGRGKPHKDRIQDSSDEKDVGSDGSPSPSPKKGSGRGKPPKNRVQDSSDKEEGDGDGALSSQKRSGQGRGQGRGRGRPRKKSVSDSDEEADSHPASVHSKGKGQGRRKNAISETESSEASSDDCTPLARCVGTGQGKSASTGQPDQDTTSHQSPSHRDTVVKTGGKQQAAAQKKRKKRTQRLASLSDSENSCSVSEAEKGPSAPPLHAKTSGQESEASTGTQGMNMPELLAERGKKQGKASGQEAVTSAIEVGPPDIVSMTTASSRGDSCEPLFASPVTVRPRAIIPVLERFAQDVLGVGREGRQTPAQERSSPVSRDMSGQRDTGSSKSGPSQERSSPVSRDMSGQRGTGSSKSGPSQERSSPVSRDMSGQRDTGSSKSGPSQERSSPVSRDMSGQRDTGSSKSGPSQERSSPVSRDTSGQRDGWSNKCGPSLERSSPVSRDTSGQRDTGSSKSGPSQDNKETSGQRKGTRDRGAASSDSDAMEIELPERKLKGKGKKKGLSSRKRKQDTALEHSRAVTKGQASPAKSSPSAPNSPMDVDQPGESVLASPPPTEADDTAPLTLSFSATKKVTDKKVPPLKIAMPILKPEPPKVKAETKTPAHSPMFLADVDRAEKQKSRDAVKSVRPQARDNLAFPPVSTVVTGVRRDLSVKTAPDTASSPHPSPTVKPDPGSRLGRPDPTSLDCKPARTDLASLDSRLARTDIAQLDSRQAADRTEQLDIKSVDSRKRYPPGSSRDFTSEVSRDSVSSVFSPTGTGKETVPGVFSPTGAGRESMPGVFSPSGTAGVSRDLLLCAASRDMPGVYSTSNTSSLYSTGSSSGVYSATSTPSLYSSVRDSFVSGASTSLTSGRGTSFASTPSRDQSHFSASPLPSGSGRDLHLASGSSRDIHLASGYIHLSSGSSRDSSYPSSPSGRDLYTRDSRGDPKYSPAGVGRLGVNSPISGKENADRPYSWKSTSSVTKKGEGMLPLDTILNSSLYAADSDKSRHLKGLDAEFDLALQRIDLEYLEKLLLPPVTPMELSDEELRQAVMDGNCYLVERALACTKPYNLDLPDNKGNTLLMHAVMRGSDDIIVHLLSRGADAQVQENGITALMLAVEHAESSTVFMLLEMGAHVNTTDHSGESALFKAVRRGDKQVLKLLLDHGADFNSTSSAALSPLQLAKQCRLADVETTLIDHVQRVVLSFEEQVNLTVRGTARLVSCVFPHHCVPLCESDTITVPFKFQPSAPSGPGMGCLLFIAHARFSQQDVKCRLYGQCAVDKVTLNGVLQPCLTEESNFVLMCHPLIPGWNELVIHTRRDATSKAKLIVCAYKAQLIYK